jgi:dTDP-4-amino-4,6-dideoxygalactose transaminase
MGVPFLDLTRQYARIRPEIESVLADVFTKQNFVLGPYGRSLEQGIQEHLSVPHAVGCASGTDAILLSLRALGVEKGDGVLTSSFTFFATAGAIHNAGGRPFFADIDASTFNLSPASVRAFLAEQCELRGEGVPVHRATGCPIRVLLPVHLYGLPAEMDELNAIAREAGLKVLEDACQAFGARYRGRAVGALGDAAAFSFFPTKNLGGSGDGGMITTPHADLADRLRKLRVHGSKVRYYHEEIGYNSRLDDIQAAVLTVKLRHVEEWNRQRAKVAERYGELLAKVPGLVAPAVPQDRSHIFHQYVLRAPGRDALKAHLDGVGVGSMIYYPVPLHLQPCFAFLGYREGDLPETERAAREVLALPIFAELTDAEIAEVSREVGKFAEGNPA